MMDPLAKLEKDMRCTVRIMQATLVVAALAIMILGFRVSEVWAHMAASGWSYPLACCSGADCREVSDEAIIRDARGYVIKATGELIPNGSPKLKSSPDGVFHWCSYGGRPDSGTICLFAPPEAY